jgi:hypothetical protein
MGRAIGIYKVSSDGIVGSEHLPVCLFNLA